MNSLWIILACGVACAYAQPTCDQSSLKRCEDMMPRFDQGEMFPSDPAELQDKCSKSIPGFNCYLEVAEVCPVLVPPKIEEYYVAADNLLHAVCTKGHYQTAYLRSAKCLNEIMTFKQSVCEARAEKVAKPYTCEYFRSIESCLKAFVRDTCSEDAQGFFSDFFDVTRSIFQNGSCD